MSKPKTHVVIILDRSGSMAPIRSQALQNYNEQIQQMKENSKEQDIYCSLITFNGEVYEHLWDQPADSLEEADESAYVPSGGTAMYDAVGYAIRKLKETVVEDENTAYLLVIISDGEENSSKHFNIPFGQDQESLRLFEASGLSDLKVLIDSCQNTKKWTFTYMGCDERYLHRVAAQTGIPISNMAKFSTKDGASASFGFTEARKSLANNYYDNRKRGRVVSSCLYSNDNTKLADFDPETAGTESSAASFIVDTSAAALPVFDASAYTSNALNSMKDYNSIPVKQQPFGTKRAETPPTNRRAKFESKPVAWKS